MNPPLEVCILAAGIGSRMQSNKPKVLQTLAGRPLLDYLLDAAEALETFAVHVVIGQGADEVRAAFADRTDINWVFQAERLGTGHAVQQVTPHLGDHSRTLIMLGDCPLVEVDTLRSLVDLDADLSVLTVDLDDPFGYGRIIRDGEQIRSIVEEKDASESEKLIREINTGLMAVDSARLKLWLEMLTDDNAQKEYLITDIVGHANDAGCAVKAHKVADPLEVTGINTFVQLSGLERSLQAKRVEELMTGGVQVMDPARLDIRGQVSAGRGVKLDVNVILEGEVTLGDNVEIGPNCVIRDAVIGDGCAVRANSVVEEATLRNDCIVGPFARLRPGAELEEEVHIGNFVEVKKSSIGKRSKANHLAYLGDATIGADVNIGAGTITCNYDGAFKHQTQIGDGAFIGTNASLVAPVTIGSGTTVGAGSTIAKDVESEVLVVGRAQQVVIKGWQKPVKS